MMEEFTNASELLLEGWPNFVCHVAMIPLRYHVQASSLDEYVAHRLIRNLFAYLMNRSHRDQADHQEQEDRGEQPADDESDH